MEIHLSFRLMIERSLNKALTWEHAYLILLSLGMGGEGEGGGSFFPLANLKLNHL